MHSPEKKSEKNNYDINDSQQQNNKRQRDNKTETGKKNITAARFPAQIAKPTIKTVRIAAISDNKINIKRIFALYIKSKSKL